MNTCTMHMQQHRSRVRAIHFATSMNMDTGRANVHVHVHGRVHVCACACKSMRFLLPASQLPACTDVTYQLPNFLTAAASRSTAEATVSDEKAYLVRVRVRVTIRVTLSARARVGWSG